MPSARDHLLGRRGQHPLRSDAVHPDSVGSEVDRERADELGHGSLGDVVRGLMLLADERRSRGGTGDRAAAAPGHLAGRGHGHEVHPADVDAQREIEVLERRLEHPSK
jgi:hypothetical protein